MMLEAIVPMIMGNQLALPSACCSLPTGLPTAQLRMPWLLASIIHPSLQQAGKRQKSNSTVHD